MLKSNVKARSRQSWPIWRRAACSAGLLGCSSPTASTDAGPAASATVGSSVATEVAASATPRSPDQLAKGAEIEPGWVSENPSLTPLLQAGSPACRLRETFMETDGKASHGYEVYAPSVARAELEQRFATAAKRLGLEVGPFPGSASDPRLKILGSGVVNEAVGLWSAVHDDRVILNLYAVAPMRESVPPLAEAARFDSWELVKSLGDELKWHDVTFDRGAHGMDVQWHLDVPKAKRSTIDEWAKRKRLERDGDDWIRTVSKADPSVSAIVISIDKDERVGVFESRAIDMLAPACRPHPSREREAAAADGAKPEPSTSADVDALEREMLGLPPR